MIRNVLILCSTGQPLYLEGEKDLVNEVLLGGFLTALQSFAESMQNTRINKIELDKRTYFYSVMDPIISVVEADAKDEIENRVYQIIAERLARAFLEMYPKDKILHWCGKFEDFEGFDPVYKRIEAETTQMLHQSQKDFITKYFVEAAKDSNIVGKVIFDLDKDEIIASDIPMDIVVKDFESFGSMLFSFVERLGKELKAGEINEILIRAKKYWIGGFRRGQLAVFMLFSQDYFGKVLPEFVSAALGPQRKE
jgi:hypothetical protein